MSHEVQNLRRRARLLRTLAEDPRTPRLEAQAALRALEGLRERGILPLETQEDETVEVTTAETPPGERIVGGEGTTLARMALAEAACLFYDVPIYARRRPAEVRAVTHPHLVERMRRIVARGIEIGERLAEQHVQEELRARDANQRGTWSAFGWNVRRASNKPIEVVRSSFAEGFAAQIAQMSVDVARYYAHRRGTLVLRPRAASDLLDEDQEALVPYDDSVDIGEGVLTTADEAGAPARPPPPVEEEPVHAIDLSSLREGRRLGEIYVEEVLLDPEDRESTLTGYEDDEPEGREYEKLTQDGYTLEYSAEEDDDDDIA